MKLTQTSLGAPVSVAVGVIFILLFGAYAFTQIPIQLTPDVETPTLTVQTRWPGASPQEIEREIVEEQEEFLKSVEGLVEMRSECRDGQGEVILEFPPGYDLAEAMLRVSNKLRQVPDYPALADEPIIFNVAPNANAVAWFVLKYADPLRAAADGRQPIETWRDLCEDVITPAFERVQGVAASNVFGGTEQEMVIDLDPTALAARGLGIDQVVRAVRGANRNISAGDFDEGKRRYTVRTIGELIDPTLAEAIVIADGPNGRVYLRDVASVAFGYADPQVSVRNFGDPSIAMNVQREVGANVIAIMEELQDTAVALNEEELAPRGLQLIQVYDETVYIYGAIDLVQQNMLIGGLMAIIVLFVFLKSGRSVFVIASAIPISVIGAFFTMFVFGRNINVISLAGMSFAIGLVVDNSIVVLENIYRHLQMRKTPWQAALDGAGEVWGAVLASTLTTMAVFIPVLFMVDQAGQLFKDIAIAISAAVALSMLVAITVIPTLSSKVMRQFDHDEQEGWSFLAWTRHIVDGIAGFVHWLCGGLFRRLLTVLLLIAAPLTLAWQLLPPADYLPTGNRNLIFGLILPPPGYNLEELTGMARQVEAGLSPHFQRYEGRPVENPIDPVISNYFFVAAGEQVFMGAIAEDESRVRSIVPLMQRELAEIPGLFPIVQQTSLFGRIAEGRSVRLELTGPDLRRLTGLAMRSFGMAMGIWGPGQAQLRPIPGLDLGNPEIRLLPDRERLAAVGLDAASLGVAVDVLLDGRRVSEVTVAGREIDIRVEGRGGDGGSSQDIADLPLATPGGGLLTVGDLAQVIPTAGPSQINRLERQRNISIQIIPPEDVSIEAAMQAVEEQIIAPLRAEGAIDGLYQARLAGTADDLSRALDALSFNFILALVITFLLMAALFEHFLYPLVIMVSVPLATVGGIIGLRLVDLYGGGQSMDLLTMLGFIILVGTVVNNAILIVHQALQLIRAGELAPREAIREAVRTRLRPIFMSTTTSVFGMLPLVLFPGAGSELYRGLGSVVVGGLICSTIFTIFLVPTLFSLVLDLRRRTVALVGGER